MVFFKTNHQNLRTCALTIILLNYNCAVTSYVLMIINKVEVLSENSKVWATASLLIGLVCGQFLFGVFGDLIGRRASFYGSSRLMLAGSILSIFPGIFNFLNGANALLIQFSFFRFILGIGAGGMFPLVAAVTRESSQEDLSNKTIASIFGPFGSIGLIIAPLAVYLFTSFVDLNDDVIWRIVVAIGVAPALVLIAMGIDETKSSNNLVSPAISPKAPPTRMSDTDSEQDLFETTSLFEINWIESFQTIQSEMSIAMKLPMLRTYLIGTSLSWFFSDMVQYGNVLLQARFLDKLLQRDDFDDDFRFTVGTLALLGAASASCFWIGGIFSVLALRKFSALALQLQGFVLTATIFFLVTIAKATLSSAWWPLTIILYASTFLFSGYGPAPTVFLMPSLLFPSSIRTTVNGIAAAIGKIGALAGLFLAGFSTLQVSTMMACFGGISLLGVASTLLLIQAHFKPMKGFKTPGPTSSVREWLEKSSQKKNQYYHYTDEDQMRLVDESEGEDGESVFTGDDMF